MAKDKKMTVHIPADLHRQAKSLAALQGRPVEQVYAELVREWLKKAQPKEPQPQ